MRGATVGWTASYVFRVANKDMTYAKQLKDYEQAVIQKRFDELSTDEVDALMGEWQELLEGKVTQSRRGRGRLGFGVPLTYGEGSPVFEEVPEDSAAAKAGLQPGDRLFEIDGDDIDSRRDVMRILREFRAGDRVEVVVERDGKGVELELELVREERR